MENNLRTNTIIEIMNLKQEIMDLEVSKAKCNDHDREQAINASLHEKRKSLREQQEVLKSIDEDWCHKTETYIVQLEAKVEQLERKLYLQAAEELKTDIVAFKKKLNDRREALKTYLNE